MSYLREEITTTGGTLLIGVNGLEYQPLEIYTPAQVVLASALSINVEGTPIPGVLSVVKWNASIVNTSFPVSIYGEVISQDCLNQPGRFEGLHDGTSWSVNYFPDFIVRPQANEKVGTITVGTGGGTKTLVAGVDPDYIRVLGSGLLTSGYTIDGALGVKDRSQFTIQIDGGFPIGAQPITVFGQTIAPVDGLNGGVVIVATFDEGANQWTSYFVNRTITTSLLPSIAGLSLLGNNTNATGAVVPITASADGAVFRRSGASIIADKLIADNFGPSLFPTMLTKVTLSASAILNSGVTPAKLLDGAGAGKIYPLFKVIVKQNYVSVPYATALNATIYSFSGTDKLMSCNGVWDFSASGIAQFYEFAPASASNQYVANDPIMLNTSTSNPTAGDSTADVYIFHSVLSL